MPAWRECLHPTRGMIVAVALLVVGGIAAIRSVHTALGTSDAVAASRQRLYLCAESGKSFPHQVVIGEHLPVLSPHTGKPTGYPAELCGWTRDGGLRSEPFPVLLNEYRRVPGPTFCPDCGRLVVHGNPPAAPGNAPPPTRQQYAPEVEGR